MRDSWGLSEAAAIVDASTAVGALRRTVVMAGMTTGNRILDSLPAHEQADVRPYLDLVNNEPKRFFLASREPVSHVYFPLQGLMSLRVAVLEGPSVQAVGVGRDGMVGVSAILGANDPPFEVVCLVAGDALRMPTDTFVLCANRLPVFHRRVLRYTHGLFNEAVRTAACNALHPIHQRLARCLLLARDRLGADQLALTHEVLGLMLGATRGLVTRTVSELVSAGLLDHRRGALHLTDGAGLERAACEDYRAIQSEYARILSG